MKHWICTVVRDKKIIALILRGVHTKDIIEELGVTSAMVYEARRRNKAILFHAEQSTKTNQNSPNTLKRFTS